MNILSKHARQKSFITDSDYDELANLKLILNLEYFNNTIKATFTAKSAVENSDLFNWVKTKAKFYFKIIVSGFNNS